jgi:hypothetical protein
VKRFVMLKIKLSLPVVLSIAFLLWVVTSAAKLLFNGLYLDLDYGLFHPDGAFYTFRTLLFIGYDKFEAGRIVAEWYATYPAKPGVLDPSSLFFENAPGTWDQYLPRVLYPLLSAPFVKLLGVWGMLAVPALTYLVVLMVIGYVSFKMGRPGVGVVVLILTTSSITISRWMYINATDGLLMLFTALFILVIHKNKNLNLSALQISVIVILITLSALTRFSALMWLAIALLFLLYRRFLVAGVIAITSVITAIPIFLRPFGNDVLPELNEKSSLEKIIFYPLSFLRISVFEIGQLFVLDRIFFWTLLLGIFLSLYNVKRLESQVFLISFTALWITGSLNSVLGVNFRYQIAVVPLMMWALVALLPSINWTRSKSLNDSAVKEE